MRKQLVLEFGDLRALEICCGSCQTSVSLDLQAGSLTPQACPSCGVRFEQAAVNQVREFLSACKVLSHPEQRLKFRLIVDEAVEKDA